MSLMQINISIGEAIDRLTILKIKIGNIKDDSKLKNIRYEHELLERSIHKHYPEAQIFPLKVENNLFGDLYKVNKELWDVEDKLREFERNKIFDDRFVQLARSVYFLNDKRASIKKEINTEFKSIIVEEKSYEKY